ncbi:hypothetical protein ASG04_09830 [Curtobacterium sp. Leaf183]|uniref:oligosaccharide flippase family protein n=1 Tax=Curtobacterium sp. Leaf183 TaxID=1736291 RepID=UPI0007003861|nr:oligosaccharide flippase family protein [Curtobacterium sp. Leaf183]KQS09164.1 hypothetical protein ASG04_09830 [Curtobacterium sp. Leaf183]
MKDTSALFSPVRRARRLLQTAGVSYLGMALSVISAPMLARELGADGRGALAASFVLVQLLSWSAFLGLPRGEALQELREGAASRRGLIVVGLLGPVTAAIAFSVADLASNGDERIATGIRAASFVLVFAGIGAVGTERALLRGQVHAVNLVRGVNLVLPSVAVIVAYFAGVLTLTSAFLFTLCAQALAVLLGVVLAIPTIRARRPVRTPWRFSLHYWAGSAFDGIGARVDQLILAALVVPSQLGVYAVAVTCASAAGGFTQALNQLTYARLADTTSSTGGADLLRLRSLLGVCMSVVGGGLIIAVVAIFGGWLFGHSYDGLLPVVSVLVVAQALSDQWQLRTYADSASGKPGALMWASAIATAMLIVVATCLGVTGLLNGLAMAVLITAFSSARLVVRRILLRAGSVRRAGRSEKQL